MAHGDASPPVQERGRSEILLDYHLRVGRVPAGHALREQRLGEGTAVALIDARRPAGWPEAASALDAAAYLGLGPKASGLIAWDVFDAVLTPGDLILLTSWRTAADAVVFEQAINYKPPDDARLRRVRVVRNYGMFDLREAPQYYPDVERGGRAGGP